MGVCVYSRSYSLRSPVIVCALPNESAVLLSAEGLINPVSAAVLIWGQTTQILCGLSPGRHCGTINRRVKKGLFYHDPNLRFEDNSLSWNCRFHCMFIVRIPVKAIANANVIPKPWESFFFRTQQQ